MLETCSISLGTLKIMSEHMPSCLVSPLILSQSPIWSMDGSFDFSMKGLISEEGCQRCGGSKAISPRSGNIPDSGPSIEALGRSPRQSLLFQLFLPISTCYIDGKS